MRETAKHQEAFEYWFRDGNPRTTNEVAMKFGMNISTVDNWKREFEWERRRVDRNAKVSDYVEDHAIMQLGDAKLKFLDIAHTTIDKYVAQLKRDEVTLTPSEFERIVRLAMFLYDQPDSRKEIVTVDAVDKAIRELEEELARVTQSANDPSDPRTSSPR